MFRLKLNARHCISCGICMDLCDRDAIDMRRSLDGGIEGSLTLINRRHTAAMMTFPFLSDPENCDGCGVCIRECPVAALELVARLPGPGGPLATSRPASFAQSSIAAAPVPPGGCRGD